MDGALSEWNVLSATLRQSSRKTCWSLLALGASCTVSVALFASQAVQMPHILGGSTIDTFLWLGWLYPPILLFLYAMYRAASVSEKAMRVAPLVNSWVFETEEDGEAVAMDPGRQYVVQFINQSEAGFYALGVRVSAFMVQKLAYYCLALTVGFVANLT
ncbi:unnamed protein product [Symbiodinium pilosum]|uniref:Uncharacterized protein n=1 Tax=Symbiodinium pilosum TaxID=2952 RepID=A0A812Y6Q8_SYMPI|nr:unnamed protein product [Symbiodinium pilosum]